MGEPFTIHLFVPDGDPQGVKIVERMNWTGKGLAFPRSAWPGLKQRREFSKAGVYILTGSAEGIDDDLPTVYVGQGEEIGTRIESHYATKVFWNWGYAFVSTGNPLNRPHSPGCSNAYPSTTDPGCLSFSANRPAASAVPGVIVKSRRCHRLPTTASGVSA